MLMLFWSCIEKSNNNNNVVSIFFKAKLKIDVDLNTLINIGLIRFSLLDFRVLNSYEVRKKFVPAAWLWKPVIVIKLATKPAFYDKSTSVTLFSFIYFPLFFNRYIARYKNDEVF